MRIGFAGGDHHPVIGEIAIALAILDAQLVERIKGNRGLTGLGIAHVIVRGASPVIGGGGVAAVTDGRGDRTAGPRRGLSHPLRTSAGLSLQMIYATSAISQDTFGANVTRLPNWCRKLQIKDSSIFKWGSDRCQTLCIPDSA
jgi:hypothetical protein